MKTIEEAAAEFSRYTDEQSGFKLGVEFAQRWISVEEELPCINLWINVKNKDNYATMRISGNIDMNFLKQNFTHWRPIELI